MEITFTPKMFGGQEVQDKFTQLQIKDSFRNESFLFIYSKELYQTAHL